ncbi:MAG: hypothetical protein K6E89_00940 [Sphaerochaetaceae bacterium]|nr:hypothetical protein [Sphaerochaetaceae bacterium]
MPTVIDAMESHISILDRHERRLRTSISKLPEGSLVVSKQRGYSRFYQQVGDKKVYLGKNDALTISALAQKQYETRTLEAVLEQREVLSGCLEKIKGVSGNVDSVYSDLDEEIRGFVRKDEATDDGYARKWSEEEYAAARKTDKHVIETMNKDLVRSKSEALIADRLFTSGIPYRYEQLLILDMRKNKIYYPDFTILNKRTHKVIYWEHLGMLGDKKYCLDNLGKLDDYSRYGIIPGKNLILTYESEGRPLSMAYVKTMIKEFLV